MAYLTHHSPDGEWPQSPATALMSDLFRQARTYKKKEDETAVEESSSEGALEKSTSEDDHHDSI